MKSREYRGDYLHHKNLERMRARFFLAAFVALGLVVSACGSEQRTLEDLRQGMPYSEAREIILDAGWQAVAVRWQDRPEMDVRERAMVEERGWTEMQMCSGTGLAHCFFEFQDAEGRKLLVQTVGGEDDPALDRWRYE